MRAALIKSLDGPDGIVVEAVAEPVPAAHEVVVRVEAAALNFMDTLICRGRYQVKPALPFSPSAEIAGVVERVGSGVRDIVAGQRVAAFIGHGGAREMVAVPSERAVVVPDGVSSAVAAGVSVTYGTAMHALMGRAGLCSGETVAVLGAAGGAGLAAVEIAALMGARVIAAARGAKGEICRAHGAAEVLDYDTVDLKDALRGLTAGRGIDVVYDCVGGTYAEQALRATAWKGRYLVVGFAAGKVPALPLNHVLLRGCDVLGVNWGEAVTRDPESHRANMRQVLDWVVADRLAPVIHAQYPLERTADAIRELDQRSVSGKLIITMAPPV